MKNNSLDDIVKCDIEISNPASNDATFDSILLVVPGPEAAGTKTMDKTVPIATVDELLEYGFTSEDAAYQAATVAFSQSPAPASVYVVIRNKVSEDEGADYEAVADVLARANAEVGFYGFHMTEFRDAEDIQAAVSWSEANEKLYGFEYTDKDNCPVQNFNFSRSFGVFSGMADGYTEGEQPVENEYAALAWMAKCFGYDPGSETWHLKEASVIVPSALGSSDKKDLEDLGINTFRRYGGCNVFFGGNVLSGEWIDVIRFRDWLKAEMQVNVFNALKVNKKVSFTDAGIGLIEGQMESTLKKGQDIGGIAPSEYDADGNETPGFTVTVPLASDLTEAERKSRKLTGCRWSARLAGAIHAVEIGGNLTF